MNPVSLIKKIGIIPAFYKIKRRILVKDDNITSLIACNGAYDYLQKYRYVLDLPLTMDKQPATSNTIWTIWLQGVDNAPELVKKCIASMVAQHGENVIVLDNSNVAKYVEIPEYITRKWQAGIIPNAHYTDVLRTLLLAKHGGVWIDATTWLFAPVPAYIRQAGIFVFQGFPIANVMASNWFISAQENNPIMLKMKNLLLEYWKKENRLVSYSIFHLFFTMAVRTEKELWEAAPYFNDVNCKMLQRELFDSFNEIRLEQIKQMSPIQKLSYKFSNEEFNKKGTFYDALTVQLF